MNAPRTPRVANAIAAMADDLTEWRRDLHRHPELAYREERTARVVAEKLAAFGFDAVATGIGGTGVVGTLHGARGAAADGRAIMLRADMDALPIREETGAAHASTVEGAMHACGHDGHTTMLLGAARRLAETRAFHGTVHFCFQPAEEGGAGARAMIEDGLLDDYPVARAFGMHNWPGLASGHVAMADGPVFAAADEFSIRLRGQGGHAAFPHTTRDPVPALAALIQALQTIVARRVDPQAAAVVSVTQVHAGHAHNVIPGEARLGGTSRSFDKAVQAVIVEEMRRMAEETGRAYGLDIAVERGANPYPPLVNDRATVDMAEAAARAAFGDDVVTRGHPPTMGGEDFAFIAERVPSAYVLIGNGDSAPLHSPAYDFCDATLPAGVALWSALVERALPPE